MELLAARALAGTAEARAHSASPSREAWVGFETMLAALIQLLNAPSNGATQVQQQ